MNAATHRCPSCGHEMRFVVTAGREFLAGGPIIQCPGCRTVMDEIAAPPKLRLVRAAGSGGDTTDAGRTLGPWVLDFGRRERERAGGVTDGE